MSNDFLTEPPSEDELEITIISFLKQTLGLLPTDQIARFKFALELGLIQRVQSDDELLVISELREENEGGTNYLDRTKEVPTLKVYLNHFRLKLLQPSEVRHRGNLLGKTQPLTGQALFLERKDLLRLLKILELTDENVISTKVFEPKFPEPPLQQEEI